MTLFSGPVARDDVDFVDGARRGRGDHRQWGGERRPFRIREECPLGTSLTGMVEEIRF